MKNNLSLLSKNEILRRTASEDCCRRAFLSGVIHTAGSLLIGSGGRLSVAIRSSNPLLKVALDGALFALFGHKWILCEDEIRLDVPNSVEILTQLGILTSKEGLQIVSGISPTLVSKPCCVSRYVGGAFVGAGSLSATANGYHLEFSHTGKFMADDLLALLASYEITARYLERKGKHIVYLKGSESVSDCLALCGAQKTALQIASMSVEGEVRRQSNRVTNCELANLDRAVDTGVRQAALFLEIVDKLTDERLIATAKARMAHHDASYEELASILGISKSGVKHRLAKLEDMARHLQMEKEHNQPNNG